jgi:hypothetical protein
MTLNLPDLVFAFGANITLFRRTGFGFISCSVQIQAEAKAKINPQIGVGVNLVL